MDCNQISYHLVDYIDSNLPTELQQQVKEHLGTCASCHSEYRQTKEMFKEIDAEEDQLPGIGLRDSFEEALAQEKRMAKKETPKSSIFIKYKVVWQVAAAILLLVTGYLAGYNNSNNKEEQLGNVETEILEMKKQIAALSLLQNESASQRIKAVSYTEEMQQPDIQVIDALINTLNNDKSSNVRLAAVYSLARFKNNKKVKNAFVKTLNNQEDPMIQIVIINLLVEMEDVKAVDELKELLNKKDLNEEVKTQAELGVKVLS